MVIEDLSLDQLHEMEQKVGSFAEIDIIKGGIVSIKYKVPIYDAQLGELQAKYLVGMSIYLTHSQGQHKYRILVDLSEIQGEGIISQKTSEVYNSFILESGDIKIAIVGLSTVQTVVTKFTLKLLRNSRSVLLFSNHQEALAWLNK